MNRSFTKEDIWVANKAHERCSILIIEKMLIKTTIRYIILYLLDSHNSKYRQINFGQNVEEWECWYVINRNVQGYGHFGNSLAVSYTVKHNFTTNLLKTCM